MKEYMVHPALIVMANDGVEASETARKALDDAGINHNGLIGKGTEIRRYTIEITGLTNKEDIE